MRSTTWPVRWWSPAGTHCEPWGTADLQPQDRLLVLGPGTIGLLAAQFARAAGVEVHVVGKHGSSLSFARSLGLDGVWTARDLPGLAFDAVIDASKATALPALALDLVEPGKRVVYTGSPALRARSTPGRWRSRM